MIELSCECGNEVEFKEKTVVIFAVDGRGNREQKEIETTNFFCKYCGKPAEICEG